MQLPLGLLMDRSFHKLVGISHIFNLFPLITFEVASDSHFLNLQNFFLVGFSRPGFSV